MSAWIAGRNQYLSVQHNKCQNRSEYVSASASRNLEDGIDVCFLPAYSHPSTYIQLQTFAGPIEHCYWSRFQQTTQNSRSREVCSTVHNSHGASAAAQYKSTSVPHCINTTTPCFSDAKSKRLCLSVMFCGALVSGSTQRLREYLSCPLLLPKTRLNKGNVCSAPLAHLQDRHLWAGLKMHK